MGIEIHVNVKNWEQFFSDNRDKLQGTMETVLETEADNEESKIRLLMTEEEDRMFFTLEDSDTIIDSGYGTDEGKRLIGVMIDLIKEEEYYGKI